MLLKVAWFDQVEDEWIEVEGHIDNDRFFGRRVDTDGPGYQAEQVHNVGN